MQTSADAIRRAPAAVALLACIGCGGTEDPGGSSCSGEESSHDAVLCIVERECAFSGCHGGGDGTAQARLDLGPAVDGEASLRELFVGVPSCEYDRMDLVAPGNPAESWLVVKLDGPHDEYGNLEFAPAADWTPPLSAVEDPCPLRDGDGSVSFGTLMPLPRSIGPVTPLADEEIALVRGWIEDGATAP